MCLELFTLHSSAVLNGVICLHVDDRLGTGDGTFELKMKRTRPARWFRLHETDKHSINCGRQYEKHASGEITISTKAYGQDLTKLVCLSSARNSWTTSSRQQKAMNFEESVDACGG